MFISRSILSDTLVSSVASKVSTSSSTSIKLMNKPLNFGLSSLFLIDNSETAAIFLSAISSGSESLSAIWLISPSPSHIPLLLLSSSTPPSGGGLDPLPVVLSNAGRDFKAFMRIPLTSLTPILIPYFFNIIGDSSSGRMKLSISASICFSASSSTSDSLLEPFLEVIKSTKGDRTDFIDISMEEFLEESERSSSPGDRENLLIDPPLDSTERMVKPVKLSSPAARFK
mmetsp:Transcript_13520/g.13097  ORF Transcript_13520/g.13097 Transcript_13520/m.13097 type:complete len:228 (-) Transcript_13520:766-1449(-)